MLMMRGFFGTRLMMRSFGGTRTAQRLADADDARLFRHQVCTGGGRVFSFALPRVPKGRLQKTVYRGWLLPMKCALWETRLHTTEAG